MRNIIRPGTAIMVLASNKTAKASYRPGSLAFVSNIISTTKAARGFVTCLARVTFFRYGYEQKRRSESKVISCMIPYRENIVNKYITFPPHKMLRYIKKKHLTSKQSVIVSPINVNHLLQEDYIKLCYLHALCNNPDFYDFFQTITRCNKKGNPPWAKYQADNLKRLYNPNIINELNLFIYRLTRNSSTTFDSAQPPFIKPDYLLDYIKIVKSLYGFIKIKNTNNLLVSLFDDDALDIFVTRHKKRHSLFNGLTYKSMVHYRNSLLMCANTAINSGS